ncbi:MAG: endonuclease III [Elusimicrobiota bacterium]
MRDRDIGKALSALKREVRRWKVPALGVVEADPAEPFRLLISCILSLRTKDAVTEAASARLFRLARTPRRLGALPARTIEGAIYPVSFYRVKARTLRGICRDLLARHAGRVPGSMEELLALKGVGRKTANLVLTLGFHKPGICVDTHVHRISNRWGYVRTKTPERTETALREKLPRRHWITYNDLLVIYGQNLCTPVSPWCSRCGVRSYCARVGVGRSR